METYLDEKDNEFIILENKLKDIKIENNKLYQENKEIEYEYNKILIEEKYYTQEKMINDSLRILGIIIIITGAILWYFKIQRYHDNMYKRNQRKHKILPRKNK
jgi:hypothetical protein